MLIYIKNESHISHVEFISYTGKYPNLCRGVLTLKIDGEEYRFGHDLTDYDWSTSTYKEDNFDSFWNSGGSCGFDFEWNSHVSDGEWKIKVQEIPEQFRKYASEIDEVFNDNVSWGCCGGCL